MNKNAIIWVLVIVILVLVGYMHWYKEKLTDQNNVSQTMINEEYSPYPDGGPITNYPNEYVLIPELKVGFRKVPGLTISYTYDKDSKTAFFSSNEIKMAAQKDKNISACVSNMFPSVAISATSIERAEFQGYAQKSLGNGLYLNTYGPQAPCYENITQATKDFFTNQSKLFSQFLDSVQIYH